MFYKSDDCQLFIKDQIPTENDFYLLEKTDAAYVVAHNEAHNKLFYVKKSDIKSSSNTSKIEIEEIISTDASEALKGLGSKSRFEQGSTLTAKELSLISAKSGHVHTLNYVKSLVQCFEKMPSNNEFSLKNRKIHLEAIEYFKNFIQRFHKNVIERNLDLSHFLTKEDATVIVNGYQQLQRLLPSDKQGIRFQSASSDITLLCSAILDFKSAFTNDKNCKAIMDKIQSRMGNLVTPVEETCEKKKLITYLMVECLKKIQSQDEFSLKNRELYIEAIEYFKLFVQHFQKDVIDPKLDMSHFLTSADADVIVNGYQQLQRLLPSNKQEVSFHSATSVATSFYEKIIDFNCNVRNNKNCNALMDEIQGKMHIMVKPDQGTRKQKILIARLSSECEKYRKHLNIEMGRAANDSNPIDEIIDSSLAAKKFNAVQNLMTTLNDKNQSATARIGTFKDDFYNHKDQLKEHRDGPLMRFIKNVSFVLSSLFFGAGLFYSKSRKETYNFTQSHGDVLSKNLQAELNMDYYKDPGFVQM